MPVMRARATRGFSRPETSQGAGNGIDAGAEAEPSKSQATRQVAALWTTLVPGLTRAATALTRYMQCQTEQHTAAASCLAVAAVQYPSSIRRQSKIELHAVKKIARGAIKLETPENRASAKAATVIAAVSSRAAASSLAQREEERSHAPSLCGLNEESFLTLLPVAARDKDYLTFDGVRIS